MSFRIVARYGNSRSQRIGLIVFLGVVIVPVVLVVVACLNDGQSCPAGEHLVNVPGGKYRDGGWVCVR